MVGAKTEGEAMGLLVLCAKTGSQFGPYEKEKGGRGGGESWGAKRGATFPIPYDAQWSESRGGKNGSMKIKGGLGKGW